MTFNAAVARNLSISPAAVRAMLARAKRRSAALKAPRTHASATDAVAIERIRESIERIVLPPGPLPLACRPAPVKPEHVTTPPAAPRRRDYERGGRLDAMQRAIGGES